MDLVSLILLVVYFCTLGVLALFGWHRYYLTYLYFRHRKREPQEVPAWEELPEIPRVTVQLPIYNEKFVLKRLLAAAAALDYPRDHLEIQLLDDSTDETQVLAQREVENYRNQGVPITYLHRKDRRGYKAGALQAGLEVARGKYIAVFDADFLPQADFLKRMIPYFYGRKKLGMVQARWGHLNQDYSLMTQAQSILLDGHFVIEHTARNRSGRFFNFNGTAGIWDRDCIADGGGWQCDTLTEDLDLSYRAQMRGWDFLYLPDLVVPAELPVDMNGFKSQQHRWAKGSIQTALKLFKPLWTSKLPLKVKTEGTIHLWNNLAYPMVLLLSVLLPLSVYIRHQHQWNFSFFIDIPIFVLATCSMATFYGASQREAYASWKSRLLYLPLNLAMGIGLAVNNTIAVSEALRGKKSPFCRTAKYAISGKTRTWSQSNYRKAYHWGTWLELALGIYFTGAIVYSFMNGLWSTLYCLAMFQLGYLYLGFLSLFQGRTVMNKIPSWEASSAPVKGIAANS